MRLYFAANLD